jgi:hypothetical protein
VDPLIAAEQGVCKKVLLGVAAGNLCGTSTWPVACRIAFKMAGAVGISTCSPSPFAPNGPSGSGNLDQDVSIGGTSPMVGIR